VTHAKRAATCLSIAEFSGMEEYRQLRVYQAAMELVRIVSAKRTRCNIAPRLP